LINFSPASERNKGPISEQLQTLFAHSKRVLEIASGSGQHAIHFAETLPHVQWQPMDLGYYYPGLCSNLAQQASNILEPLEVDLDLSSWLPNQNFDAIFSANALHIMSWPQVVRFFNRSGEQLQAEGLLCIYGPFKYNHEYTSLSNAQFDCYLKNNDLHSGIRDFEAVMEQAERNQFQLLADTPMPSNNQLLSFIKTT
jgi:cyclopropane fatty-acyl-phospholipid synthase-like methyltransferase